MESRRLNLKLHRNKEQQKLLGIQQRLSQPLTGSSRRFDPVAKCQQLRTMVLDKPIAEKNWLLEKIEGVG